MSAKSFISVAAFAAVTSTSTLTSAAYAQWTVTNLDPARARESVALAASGGQQAGYAEVDGGRRASLWSGTADSWVDLHPAGATESFAFGLGGGQQAGYALVGGKLLASLWSGTADSWVDLNPAGSVSSQAFAASGGQQAGYADIGGGMDRASLWSGTADSWVDLHPPGATESQAFAASGGQQAGYAILNGAYRASLWSGTADSWVDLSAFLPAGFVWSRAQAISSDGVNTYVTGYGRNSDTGEVEALLWTRPIPTPGAAVVLGLGGLLAAGRRRR